MVQKLGETDLKLNEPAIKTCERTHFHDKCTFSFSRHIEILYVQLIVT